jgi:hypothetical protein
MPQRIHDVGIPGVAVVKLSKIKLGLLINFNTVDLKKGIQRLIM